ncbi:MAG: hypothetical protein H0W49_06950 [Nitrospirales bacterium]|nr:hypothetical protein [Nitrospirales bacterium]
MIEPLTPYDPLRRVPRRPAAAGAPAPRLVLEGLVLILTAVGVVLLRRRVVTDRQEVRFDGANEQ